jgi:hypothetical protein
MAFLFRSDMSVLGNPLNAKIGIFFIQLNFSVEGKKVNVFLDGVSFGRGLVCGACSIQKNDPGGLGDGRSLQSNTCEAPTCRRLCPCLTGGRGIKPTSAIGSARGLDGRPSSGFWRSGFGGKNHCPTRVEGARCTAPWVRVGRAATLHNVLI